MNKYIVIGVGTEGKYAVLDTTDNTVVETFDNYILADKYAGYLIESEHASVEEDDWLAGKTSCDAYSECEGCQ